MIYCEVCQDYTAVIVESDEEDDGTIIDICVCEVCNLEFELAEWQWNQIAIDEV